MLGRKFFKLRIFYVSASLFKEQKKNTKPADESFWFRGISKKGFMGTLKRLCSLVFFVSLTFLKLSAHAQTICQEECVEVAAPNVITPNGDDINDFFTLYYDPFSCRCAFREVSFVVYNRWGKEVFCFFSPDYASKELRWYGETGEKDLSESCYYYRAEVNFIDFAGSRTLKGWIKVIRGNG